MSPVGASARAPGSVCFYHSRAESINRGARPEAGAACRPQARRRAHSYGAGLAVGAGSPGSGVGIGSLKFSGVIGAAGAVRVSSTSFDGLLS